MQFTRAATKHKAIVTAIAHYNNGGGWQGCCEHAGEAKSLITPDELLAQRRQG